MQKEYDIEWHVSCKEDFLLVNGGWCVMIVVPEIEETVSELSYRIRRPKEEMRTVLAT
jgi:hypothetical protein